VGEGKILKDEGGRFDARYGLSHFIIQNINEGKEKWVRDPNPKGCRQLTLAKDEGDEDGQNRMQRDGRSHADENPDGHSPGNFFRLTFQPKKTEVKKTKASLGPYPSFSPPLSFIPAVSPVRCHHPCSFSLPNLE